MVRPTLLVAEPEPLQAISVRKLILETAKYNVLTAHSREEGLELVRLFPNIAGAVVVIEDMVGCNDVARSVKTVNSDAPVIALYSHVGQRCDAADHHISSFEPQELLDLVRSLFGDPRKIDGTPRRGEV